MPHEPSGSCPPVQQAPTTRCAACGQARPLTEYATVAGRCTSCCSDCRRAAARLAGRRRAAAVRLLIALHPEERAGLLALVGGHRHVPATPRRAVAGMAERSARRPRRVAVVDAPSARAASLASSAALPRPPGDRLTRPSSSAVGPPGNPPGIAPGIPPATDGGGHPAPLTRVAAGQGPLVGPVGRKNRGRLAPLGGVERPRRAVRFAQLIHRRGRALGQAFGLRRLRRHPHADRIATLGSGAA
jgi:hypothetical protein